MWCEIDGVQIHYETFGEGRPVILLHGWSMDHHIEAMDYEPIFARRSGWQRYYLDLPGMGQSISQEWVRTQDDILTVVLRFIDRVLPGRRFALAGTSLGAYLARGVVRDRAAAIDGLLLRMPCVIADNARRTLPVFQPLIRDDRVMAALSDTEREELKEVPVERADFIRALQPISREVRRAESVAAEVTREIRADTSRYGFSFDVDALTVPFGAPTLIITGRQDTAVGYRDAWQIIENYPRATFAVMDRADHGWPVDRLELFHSLVNDWLDRIEEMPT